MKNKGITLITLIITTIILLILAGISIAILIGESGLLTKVSKAAEKAKIAEYTEKIELIKADLYIKNSGIEITINQIKEMLDKEENKSWVENTDIIIDEEIEKIALTTKDGYIFYITVSETEYKGNNKSEDSNIKGKLKAEDISFTPNDASWNIKDVKQALDYLYNN